MRQDLTEYELLPPLATRGRLGGTQPTRAAVPRYREGAAETVERAKRARPSQIYCSQGMLAEAPQAPWEPGLKNGTPDRNPER